MAEGINVRFKGQLQRFIESRVGESGMYSSASEYIRDLVRHDFAEAQRREKIFQELKAGLEADQSELLDLDVEKVKREAREQYASKDTALR